MNTEQFYPRVFDIHVDFERHRMPMGRLRDELNELQGVIESLTTDCDYQIQKNAILFSFMEGRLLFVESGLIILHLRNSKADLSKKLLENLIPLICTKGGSTGWSLKNERFIMDADLIFEIQSPVSVVETLRSIANVGGLKELLAINEEDEIYAVGFTLFLDDLKQKMEDIKRLDRRIRVEPLSSDPEGQYYVRLSTIGREFDIEEVNKRIDEMINIALRIQKRMERAKK